MVLFTVVDRVLNAALPLARTPRVLRRIQLLAAGRGCARLSRSRAAFATLLIALASTVVGTSALDYRATAADQLPVAQANPPNTRDLNARDSIARGSSDKGSRAYQPGVGGPPRSYQLSGVVLDPAGKPVGEAFYRLVDVSNPKGIRRLNTYGKTNARGEFLVADLPAGKYQVEVAHDDWCGVRTPIVKLTAQRLPQPLTITLSAGQTASGRVTTLRDGKPSPVEGVLIHANLDHALVQLTVAGPYRQGSKSLTNKRGEFILQGLAPGAKYTAYVSNSEWRGERGAEFVIPQEGNVQDLVLTMPAEGVIRGVVIDATGMPVAGTHVKPTATHQGFGNRFAISSGSLSSPLGAVTDAEGRFHLGKLDAAKKYHLLLTADGHAPLPTDPFSASGDQEQQFTLAIGATLRGHVVDDATGAPVAGLNVRVTPSSASRVFSDLAWTVVTDKRGEFALPHMANTHYSLLGVWSGDKSSPVVSPATATVRHGVDTSVELRTYPSVTVRGVVQDEHGKPLPAASVQIDSKQYVKGRLYSSHTAPVISDDQGRFEVAGLGHGELHGSAKLKGYVAADESNQLQRFGGFYSSTHRKPLANAQPGEVVENAKIVLKRSPEYELLSSIGLVVDPQNKPVSGIRVALYYARGFTGRSTIYSRGNSTQTNEVGQYTFEDEPGGAAGLVVIPTKQQPFYGARTVELYGTGTVEQDALQLERCGSVQGVVVDDQGKPIPEVSVYAQPKNRFVVYSEAASISAITDSEGRFQFPLLRPGTCKFYCGKKGYAELPRRDWPVAEIIAGKRLTLPSITLESLQENRFRGRLVDLQGRPLADWRVAGGRTAEDGWFEYTLKQGVHTLGFYYERGDYETGVRVHYNSGPIDFPRQKPDAGQEFVVSTGGILRGRLLIAETGKPPGVIKGDIEIDYQQRQAPKRFGLCAARTISANVADLLQPDGSFSWRGFPMGHCTLTLTGDEIAETKLPVHIGDSGVADLGEIRLPQGRTVTGKLVGPDGVGISGVAYRLRVEGRLASGRWMPRPHVTLDPQGVFRVTRLPKDVNRLTFLAVLNSRGQSAQSPNRSDLVAFRDKLELESSTTIDFGQLPVKSYRLVGRLLDKATGKPPKLDNPASIAVIAETKNVFELRRYPNEKAMQPDGRFSLEHFRPDFESLRIERQGYLPIVFAGLRADAPSGIIDLGDIVFDQGLTLRGVLRGPKGEPVYRGAVSIKTGKESGSHFSTDDEGRFEITGLRAGQATIFAYATKFENKNNWIPLKKQGISRVKLTQESVEIREDENNYVELTLPTTQPE